jgi:hypothetical protein
MGRLLAATCPLQMISIEDAKYRAISLPPFTFEPKDFLGASKQQR